MRLPHLDIAVWRSDPSRFARQLRQACHHDGFFQLRHRIPTPLVEHVKSEARNFFAQDTEHKDAIDYRGSPAFRGYMACGVENTAGRPDLREQVEIAAEGELAAADAWPAYHRLRGPNQWPPGQPSLQPAIADYTQHMLQVSSELTHALCAALGLEHTALDAWFAPTPHWQLKLASYQPSTDAGGSTAVEAPVGVGAHTDSGFLTMLLQVRLRLRRRCLHPATTPPPPHRHPTAMPPPCRRGALANEAMCVPCAGRGGWAAGLHAWRLGLSAAPRCRVGCRQLGRGRGGGLPLTCPRHCALGLSHLLLPFYLLPTPHPFHASHRSHPAIAPAARPHLNPSHPTSTASQPHLNQRLRHAWQVASGGYLLATPHRVLSTPVTRLSVPFFYNPSLETVVEPLALPSSLAWERDAAYDSQTRRRS